MWVQSTTLDMLIEKDIYSSRLESHLFSQDKLKISKKNSFGFAWTCFKGIQLAVDTISIDTAFSILFRRLGRSLLPCQ